MPQRVTATAAALDLLERLGGQHGDLIVHVSGGCCDGSSPMCLRAADLPASPHDVQLGAPAGIPVFQKPLDLDKVIKQVQKLC